MIYFHEGRLHDGAVSQEFTSPAFRYGAGFFETVYYNGKEICHLDAHVARLAASLNSFGFALNPHGIHDFHEAVTQVIHANNLSAHAARINLFCSLNEEGSPVSPLITAVSHTPQPEKTYRLQLASLAIQHPYLAHKSMNYMFHWMERRKAVQNGYDDAVLIQPGNTLLETTTAALLFSDGDCFCVPAGGDRLPSTSLAIAADELSIRECSIRAHTAPHFRHAYVLNSIIGMRPVVALGNAEYEPDEKTCRKITERICLLQA